MHAAAATHEAQSILLGTETDNPTQPQKLAAIDGSNDAVPAASGKAAPWGSRPILAAISVVVLRVDGLGLDPDVGPLAGRSGFDAILHCRIQALAYKASWQLHCSLAQSDHVALVVLLAAGSALQHSVLDCVPNTEIQRHSFWCT